jgi:hypothetical protein
MTVTVSQLRQDIYRMLDQSLETGKPLMIRRKGRLLKVVPEAPLKSKLSRLTPHDCIVGDPEALVHADWSREWGEGKGLL